MPRATIEHLLTGWSNALALRCDEALGLHPVAFVLPVSNPNTNPNPAFYICTGPVCGKTSLGRTRYLKMKVRQSSTAQQMMGTVFAVLVTLVLFVLSYEPRPKRALCLSTKSYATRMHPGFGTYQLGCFDQGQGLQ